MKSIPLVSRMMMERLIIYKVNALEHPIEPLRTDIHPQGILLSVCPSVK
jgi:hypothetical protein